MEQSEGFTNVVDTIRALEKQLSLCGDAMRLCEQTALEAEAEVQEHFMRGMRVVLARKVTLGKEIMDKASHQKRCIEDTQLKLERSISAFRQTLLAGSLIYESNKNAADLMWQGLSSIPIPQVSAVRIKSELPRSFFEVIESHGKVDSTIINPMSFAAPKPVVTPVPTTALKHEPTHPSRAQPSLVSSPASTIAKSEPKSEPKSESKSEPKSEHKGVPTSPSSIPTSASTSVPTSAHSPTPSSAEAAKVLVAEAVTTLAGSAQGKTDGTGVSARFHYCSGVCFNPHDECLYVCDSNNHSIRRVTSQGEVSTFVGANNGITGPFGIVMNHKQNAFYVSCFLSHKIMKITSSGEVSVFAGSGNSGYAVGAGLNANFDVPTGIAIDQKSGNLFVCDSYNNMIRKISPQGEVTTLAGLRQGFADGKFGKFDNPCGICYDEASQSLLVCDNKNNKLRRVQLNGDVSTLCDIQQPRFVAVVNKIILVSSDSCQVHKVTPKGLSYELEVLAGSGKNGTIDGTAKECSFNYPKGIAVQEDFLSCIIVAELYAIRKISLTV